MDFDQIKQDVISKSSRLSLTEKLDLIKDINAPFDKPSQLTLF